MWVTPLPLNSLYNTFEQFGDAFQPPLPPIITPSIEPSLPGSDLSILLYLTKYMHNNTMVDVYYISHMC